MLVVIATYFGFAPRLVLPLFLLTLPAAAEVVRDLAGRTRAHGSEPGWWPPRCSP